jgi:hypothetical protein
MLTLFYGNNAVRKAVMKSFRTFTSKASVVAFVTLSDLLPLFLLALVLLFANVRVCILRATDQCRDSRVDRTRRVWSHGALGSLRRCRRHCGREEAFVV